MVTVMEFISDWRALILPVIIIIELIALFIVIRTIWIGFKDDFDLGKK